MLNPTKIKSVTMGIPWSAEVVVGEVEGYCDERFIEVKRQFAAQRLAQLCVYVEGQMVVRKIFFPISDQRPFFTRFLSGQPLAEWRRGVL